MKKHENIKMEVDVLGALGCMNIADFEEKKFVNDNIVLDVFIICQKLRHVVAMTIPSHITIIIIIIVIPSKSTRSHPH